MAGVDLVTVMKLGSWSDLKMVQRYAHLSPSHKAQAIESIAEKFHNAFHNAPNSAELTHLAERQVSM
jgi:hypothetical protein